MFHLSGAVLHDLAQQVQGVVGFLPGLRGLRALFCVLLLDTLHRSIILHQTVGHRRDNTQLKSLDARDILGGAGPLEY